MQLLLLSICLSIFSWEATSASEPYYAITVPAQMVYPSQEKACVSFPKLKGELKLTMELKKEQQSVLVAEDTVNKPTYFHCYSFELPSVVNEEVWFFHVSAHGDNININQTKKVMLLGAGHMTFIQTNKPNYKPGETVSFRIVTLDRNFLAKNDKYPLVELIDPNKNRIQQWLDVTPHQGIAELTFPLANDLPLGDYRIGIPNVYTETFSVSEYVLKRFSLKTDFPQWVYAMDKSFNVKACGSYSYGKPVLGNYELFVCKDNYRSFNIFSLAHEDNDFKDAGNCQKITEHTDDKGCLSTEIDMALFNMSKIKPYDIFFLRVSLTEEISGDIEKASSITFISPIPDMRFEQIPEFYQKGIPFTAKLKVTSENNKPKGNQTVYLVLGFEEENVNLTSVTNEEGIAVFTVDTSTWDDMVSVSGKLSLDGPEEEMMFASRSFVWLHPLYSESNSYLNVDTKSSSLSCDPDQSLSVEYFINTSELDPAETQLPFFYFYVSKGAILTFGEYHLNIKEQTQDSLLQGSFTLKIPIGAEYFPRLTFVVYTILKNGDIPSYTREFTIPICLKNKVELKFAKEEVRPGEKVNLEVRAEPGSLCSVRSLDKGLLHNNKNAAAYFSTYMLQMIASMVSLNKRGWPYTIEDFEKYPCLRNEQDPQSGTQEAAWYHGDADVYMMLKQSNLKIFTNTKIRKPVMCASQSFIRRISKQPYKTVQLETPPHSKDIEEKSKLIKRTLFPETWLYDLVSVGPQGHTTLNLTTPHSITTWETDAFCLGKSGFGEMSDVKLTTFQPYFIDLVLPYSVVQGEKFTITAYVYNYIKTCITVFASLSEPRNYPPVGILEQSQCICEDQSASFIWNVSASKPGNLKVHVSSSYVPVEGGCSDQLPTEGKDQKEDTIEKTILVRSAGILEENTQTSFLCPSGDSVRRTVTLEVPEKVVPGSDQASITVFGNIMGNTISHIGYSLEIPMGSGEQNLRNFIPISHIVKYLESIKKLTPELKETANTFLTKGYLSQLMFKKNDGSYSVYQGIPGSTWLTAFTVRSFSHAQDLIYIQEKHIDDAVKWLSSLQLPSGCFKEVGKIFNNYLMREDKDNVTLTAYITIALLEHGRFFNVSVVENALKCLKNTIDDVTTIYTQALLAYVFTLSNDGDLKKRVLDILETSAVRKDENKYWAAHENGTGDVEISSYVLLALLSDQTTSHRDIEEASPIVNWIVKHQGRYGGFYSTQDTAVALQALTKYAKATYTENLDVTVSVRSLSGFHKQFHVDTTNSLLVQKEVLPDVPGEYTLTATGTGCIYVQTYMKYHTPLSKSEAFFRITVSTEPSVCTDQVKKGLDIVLEASYSGERMVTNTVIIEVQLLSGFIPNKKSVRKLKENPLVRTTKITPDKVIIYLEKVTHEAEILRFSINQELLVNNLQAAKVKIYDYYAPDEYAVTDYNSPCNTEKEKDI